MDSGAIKYFFMFIKYYFLLHSKHVIRICVKRSWFNDGFQQRSRSQYISNRYEYAAPPGEQSVMTAETDQAENIVYMVHGIDKLLLKGSVYGLEVDRTIYLF